MFRSKLSRDLLKIIQQFRTYKTLKLSLKLQSLAWLRLAETFRHGQHFLSAFVEWKLAESCRLHGTYFLSSMLAKQLSSLMRNSARWLQSDSLGITKIIRIHLVSSVSVPTFMEYHAIGVNVSLKAKKCQHTCWSLSQPESSGEHIELQQQHCRNMVRYIWYALNNAHMKGKT